MPRIIVRKRTVFIFLTLIGLLAYSNSLRVPFHYDDFHFLKENIIIKSFPLFLDWITDNPSNIITGRAFLLFTFYLNYLVNGLDTFGYHIVNLLIHISTAFLFYLLLAGYVNGIATPPSVAYNDREQRAIIASSLFLLHPINTESVTYISSRSSELSTFFILASMLMFFKASQNRFSITGYLLSIVFFLLGLSTKQSAVVTPILLLIFDLYFISHSYKKLKIKYHIPFWLIIIISSFYYSGYITKPEMYDRPWLTHILTELKVFAIYLKLLILPFGLNIDHSIRESVSLDLWVIISIVIIITLLLIAILLRDKNRVLSFSIIWFFVNLAPFLAVRLSDYMTERWVYTAVLGFSLGLAELLIILLSRYKKIGVFSIVSITLFLATMTYMRNNVYKDPITLWADAAQKSPEKIRPYTNLCASYLERGYIDKAIEMCKTALEKGSIEAETYINLSSAYFLKNDLNKAEAILLSIADISGIEIYHYNLGVIYRYKEEYNKAIEEFKKVLKINPRSPAALASIGLCYKQLGMKDKADEYFHLATEGIPQSGEDYLRLAESFFQLGENDKGTESLNKALITNPLDIGIRNIIATLYLEAKNYDVAYKHFSIMAKISPNYAPAYKGMGLAMLEKGNLSEARKHFKKALSLLPPDSTERTELLELLKKAEG